MRSIKQFSGKRYHEDCFEEFLEEEKAKGGITSDYTPNTKNVSIDDLDDGECCEYCGESLARDDDEGGGEKTNEDAKKDPVVDTPSLAPPRRRGR